MFSLRLQFLEATTVVSGLSGDIADSSARISNLIHVRLKLEKKIVWLLNAFFLVCAAKRRVELKRARLSGEVPSDEEWPGIQDISIEEKQGVIEPGVKSTPGGSFDFVCPKYQAIDRVDVDMVDNDLVFAFYCDNVTTTGLQVRL